MADSTNQCLKSWHPFQRNAQSLITIPPTNQQVESTMECSTITAQQVLLNIARWPTTWSKPAKETVGKTKPSTNHHSWPLWCIHGRMGPMQFTGLPMWRTEPNSGLHIGSCNLFKLPGREDSLCERDDSTLGWLRDLNCEHQ